jgi:hypothetical protein
MAIEITKHDLNDNRERPEYRERRDFPGKPLTPAERRKANTLVNRSCIQKYADDQKKDRN